MSNKFFKSIFAFAMVLGTALGFVGCTPEEETKADPKVELSVSTLNFSAAEESKTVNVTSNSEWQVTVDTAADWVNVTPTSGKNKGTITVHVADNTTGAARTTKVKVSALHPEYGGWDHKQLTINQSADENEAVEEEVLYSDDFDGAEATKEYGSSNSSWPYIDQFVDFVNKQGPASVDVLYEGNKVSVRANEPSSSENYSTYAGSGVNNIFFGDGGYFVVKNIAPLKADTKNYKISFGLYKNKDGLAFENKQFLLYISKDAEKWAPVEYTVGTMEGSKFSVATADFTLTTLPERLHIKFVAREASVFRIDDLKFYAGNGGQNIDLDNVVEVAPELPEMTEVTAEQFLAAAEDATIYKLTGEITRVVNATYGNFDITDATGTVYVYGLLTPTGEAQKQFAAAGLKQGDTITVYGTRTSYNDAPQMKNATYISHVAGEGGNDEPNTPATGVYASDSAFVCSADDSTNAAYSLGSTTIGGESVTGFKLGKGQQAGKFTSGAVSVSGNKYLNFYAQGWKGGDVTLYFRVNGGATMSQKLASHDGVTGNPPFTALAFAATDHYSVLLEGLTETSTIEFSTDANFELTTSGSTMASARAIVCGVKLSDEPIEGVEPVIPEPVGTVTVAEAIAAADGVGVTIENATVIGVYARGILVEDTTGKLLIYSGSAVDAVVGDVVKVEGTMATYAGLRQVGGTVVVSKTGTTTYEYPAIETMDGAALEAYLSTPSIKYVMYTGKLTISGNYYNVNVEGASTAVGSLSYPLDGAVDASLNGQTVDVRGWVIGVSSSKYVNTMVSSVVASGNTPVDPTPDPTPDPDPTPEPTPDPTPGEDPVAGDTATIDFNNADNRVSFTTEQQVWSANGITVTNDKGSSTSNVGDYTAPARFYKSSSLTIAAEKAFSQIVFNCDNYKNTYPTDLQNSITSGSVSVDGTVVTVTLDSAATSYSIATLAGQVRVDSITVAFAK